MREIESEQCETSGCNHVLGIIHRDVIAEIRSFRCQHVSFKVPCTAPPNAASTRSGSLVLKSGVKVDIRGSLAPERQVSVFVRPEGFAVCIVLLPAKVDQESTCQGLSEHHDIVCSSGNWGTHEEQCVQYLYMYTNLDYTICTICTNRRRKYKVQTVIVHTVLHTTEIGSIGRSRKSELTFRTSSPHYITAYSLSNTQ